MKYYKKSCILRQLKQGFSGDGKQLTGLIKVEKYGKNLAVEISIINFAPLTQGEYYCLLSDGYGNAEKLPLRGKCYFNLLSDFRLDDGFCGVICFVNGDIVPIACGINGERRYDFKQIVLDAFPPIKKEKIAKNTQKEAPRDEFSTKIEENEPPTYPPESAQTTPYDDEKMSLENYYEKEQADESDLPKKGSQNVSAESGISRQEKDERDNPQKDVDDEDVRHAFTVDGKGYYDAVQDEIDALFAAHPRDYTLASAFSASDWIRIKGEEGSPQYLVGVVYEEFRPKYICYAIAAEDETAPPKELGDACIFVPVHPFDDKRGFFVIFQNAATGECIRPKRQ